jgi:hypothetical protein
LAGGGQKVLRKVVAAALASTAIVVTQFLPVAACGALVAPNGAIRLSRATTLVSWHAGVERYLTSFVYHGAATNFGWIVPLPAVPTKIEEGGAWTLQRLFRETHPQPKALFFADRTTATAPAVEVLQQVKVEALDITVLRGSGQAVLDWAKQNGFITSDETRDHLKIYAQGSPIFMAAKYDASAARARGQLDGDGAPVLITMKTEHLWVPLEVLALGTPRVQADLYLLTDKPVNTSEFNAVIGQSAVASEVPGAPGFRVQTQEPVNATLFHDLSTDRNMGWVRQDSWLTYLSLDASSQSVTYDLGISPTGVIKLARFGTKPTEVVDGPGSTQRSAALPTLPIGSPQALFVLALLAGAIGSLRLAYRSWNRRR